MEDLPPPPPPSNHGEQARARKPKTNVTGGPRPMWLPHPDQRQQGGPFPPPLGLLPPPPPPLVPVWISPNPPPPVMVLSATGYEPYSYIWFRPVGPPFPLPMSQPRPPPHPCPQQQVNRSRASMDAERRGTGVFLTPSGPELPVSNINSHNSSIRGMSNKQGADETNTHQTQKPQNTNASDRNDGVVKLEEGHQNTGTPSLEMGLPEEWPYKVNISHIILTIRQFL